METYSPRSTDRLTPLRMWVRASAVPRERWTFWARRSGGRAFSALSRVASDGAKFGVASVSATDHLDRIVFRSATRGIDCCDQRDCHGADERGHILPRALAHKKPFRFDQPFDGD